MTMKTPISKRAFQAVAIAMGATFASAGATGWKLGRYAPPGVSGHAAAQDAARGTTVVFGGGFNRFSNETFVYDGTAWAPGPVAPAGLVPRTQVAMVYDSKRQVIVMFGGADDYATCRNDTWELDGTSWTQGPAAPPALLPRRAHGMAFDTLRGKTVLFGGGNGGSGGGYAWYEDVWEYDGTAWTAPPVAPGPMARQGFAMAYDEVRHVTVVFGGLNELDELANDTWEYDGTAWAPGPAAPAGLTPRWYPAMAYDASRQAMILFGGNALPLMADTWSYDGAAWTPGPAAPTAMFPREAPAMVYDPGKGYVRLFGGLMSGVNGSWNISELNDTWALAAGAWTQEAPYPLARYGEGMAYDSARGVGVLYGGVAGFGLDDVWELDGDDWRELPPAPMGPRMAHGMTYDAARHRIVVFGGSGAGGFFGDTWEFDGNAWVRGPAAPAGLYARAYTPLAYDSARGVSVVFSGVTSCYPGCQPADTWEYDGTSWRQGPAAPPGMVARYGHAMDYDAARGVIVLVGGFTVDGSDQPLNDVWEYDGSQWRSGTPLPPLVFPRLAHSTTYDLTRRRLVIFGGGDDPDPTMGNAFGDVWEGDGSSWDPGATTPPLLGARRYHASFFDSARARIVIFGGIDQGHAERGDVWEYGAVRDAIVVAAGHGAPNANRIAVIDETGQPTATDFLAYQAGTWGATGRAGQLSGDALAEIVTGPGPGPTLGPQARAFTNRGTGLAKVNFYAYGTLRYGVAATAASIDGDAWDEIVTGPGGGPVFGPHVRGWNVDGAGVTPISAVSFFAYATLKYGARPDGGDLDADGYGEILTGPGPGAMFGPHVRGWNVDGGAVQAMSKASFFAFQATTHGVEVAGGDVDLDGFAEIAAAPGPDPGAAPRAAGFDYDGATVSALPGFATTPGATAYGGRIALGDLSASDAAELLLSPGPDPAAAAAIETYAYDGAALSGVLPPLLAFSTMAYGVNVAGGILGL